MAVDAQVHLHQEVSNQVVHNFMTIACQQTDSDEVIKIMETIDSYKSTDHDEFVETIRKHHAVKLLRNKAYLEELCENHRGTLGRLIDYVVDPVKEDSCDDSDSSDSSDNVIS